MRTVRTIMALLLVVMLSLSVTPSFAGDDSWIFDSEINKLTELKSISADQNFRNSCDRLIGYVQNVRGLNDPLKTEIVHAAYRCHYNQSLELDFMTNDTRDVAKAYEGVLKQCIGAVISVDTLIKKSAGFLTPKLVKSLNNVRGKLLSTIIAIARKCTKAFNSPTLNQFLDKNVLENLIVQSSNSITDVSSINTGFLDGLINRINAQFASDKGIIGDAIYNQLVISPLVNEVTVVNNYTMQCLDNPKAFKDGGRADEFSLWMNDQTAKERDATLSNMNVAAALKEMSGLFSTYSDLCGFVSKVAPGTPAGTISKIADIASNMASKGSSLGYMERSLNTLKIRMKYIKKVSSKAFFWK